MCLERVFTSSVVAIPKSVLENCPIKGRRDLSLFDLCITALGIIWCIV